MRALGIDIGKRRVGLAISDASRTLARPLETIAAKGPREAVELVGRAIDRLAAEEDGVDTIVVGMPSRLDGTPTTDTAYASSFVAALRQRTKITIVTEGERLTSHEADSRLAERERDWRKRKAKLDAAAAAIILQDYLDRR
ncbi:MAG TPA: Holliday junction resolvase RuvX [Vicinamibacterales bacterium]